MRWREANLDHQCAKLLVRVQVLELLVGRERGELKIVPLVGDFEILQGVVILPQGRVGGGHIEGGACAAVERFQRGRQSLLKQSPGPARS
jgi:hypothetical protein